MLIVMGYFTHRMLTLSLLVLGDAIVVAAADEDAHDIGRFPARNHAASPCSQDESSQVVAESSDLPVSASRVTLATTSLYTPSTRASPTSLEIVTSTSASDESLIPSSSESIHTMTTTRLVTSIVTITDTITLNVTGAPPPPYGQPVQTVSASSSSQMVSESISLSSIPHNVSLGTSSDAFLSPSSSASRPSGSTTLEAPRSSSKPTHMSLSISTGASVASRTSITTGNRSSTSLPATNITCLTSTPPAPTQTDIVRGCQKWHVAVSGEYCSLVAQEADISLETFFAWNPAVDPPNCPSLLAGFAYCIGICGNISLPSTTPSNGTATSAGLSSTYSYRLSLTTTTASSPLASLDAYRTYKGNGSPQDGWPEASQWVSFEYMFDANRANMQAACAQWGVPNDTDDELAHLQATILDVGAATAIDPRFILAVVIQESTGCVRVITTSYSVLNPGLMQSHNGTGTCNTNRAALGIPGVSDEGGIVQYPCPESAIRQMILDGTNGTAWGDGLVQIMRKQGSEGAMGYYRTARIYNGGGIDPTGELDAGCCTLSYVSDVANRLTGWVAAPRNFTL